MNDVREAAEVGTELARLPEPEPPSDDGDPARLLAVASEPRARSFSRSTCAPRSESQSGSLE
jgi:hypothetical protein